MAKVNLICGKICSGKSHYASIIKSKINAVILSCDEITKLVQNSGAKFDHDLLLSNTKNYLLNKACELANLGVNIILDWGFWTKQERDYVKEYFTNKNIEVLVHYVKVSDKVLDEHIKKRNSDILNKTNPTDYYIDDGLKTKLNSIWQEPSLGEVDVVFNPQN